MNFRVDDLEPANSRPQQGRSLVRNHQIAKDLPGPARLFLPNSKISVHDAFPIGEVGFGFMNRSGATIDEYIGEP